MQAAGATTVHVTAAGCANAPAATAYASAGVCIAIAATTKCCCRCAYRCRCCCARRCSCCVYAAPATHAIAATGTTTQNGPPALSLGAKRWSKLGTCFRATNIATLGQRRTNLPARSLQSQSTGGCGHFSTKAPSADKWAQNGA